MGNDETPEGTNSLYVTGKCNFCGKVAVGLELKPSNDKKVHLCLGCLKKFENTIERRNKRGMYNKLQDFFKGIPQQQEQVALNMSDFTNIMRHDLPKTAYKDRPWWANTDSSPQGNSWLSAGWELANIYLHAKVAVFRRKAENPLKGIPRYVKAILDGRSHIMQPPAHMLTGWIRFCRKVGWYFEGTMLYERGGLSLDSLSEAERTEVEEDYTVCKREVTLYRHDKNIQDINKEKDHAEDK